MNSHQLPSPGERWEGVLSSPALEDHMAPCGEGATSSSSSPSGGPVRCRGMKQRPPRGQGGRPFFSGLPETMGRKFLGARLLNAQAGGGWVKTGVAAASGNRRMGRALLIAAALIVAGQSHWVDAEERPMFSHNTGLL